MGPLLPRSLQGLLLLSESVLLALVVIAGGLGAAGTLLWRDSSEEALRMNGQLQQAERIRGDLYRQIGEATRARLMEDVEALAVLPEYASRIAEHFEQLAVGVGDPGEQLAVEHLLAAYGVVQADLDRALADPFQPNDAARMKLLDPAYGEWMLSDFESALRVFNEVMADRQRVLRQAQARWLRYTPWLVGATVLLGGVLLVFTHRRLQRGLVGPVAALVNGAERISRGELESRIDEWEVTELDRLARSFNHMAGELAQNRAALVESERRAALAQLVPVVAHNIRNPLASIRATAQLVDEQSTHTELAETRTAIIECVDRLDRWVSSLLSYLRPFQPQLVPASLTGVLEPALQLLRPRLEERSLRIERLHFDQDTPCPLHADLLEQALYGLLNNAVEASPAGASIEVSMDRRADTLELRIDDHGAGIGFEPRPADLSPLPSTKRYGTGLGLPFAFKVIQAHGGSLDIAAREGGGTRVRIRLPRAARGHGETT